MPTVSRTPWAATTRTERQSRSPHRKRWGLPSGRARCSDGRSSEAVGQVCARGRRALRAGAGRGRATRGCTPALRRCALPPGEGAGLGSSVRIKPGPDPGSPATPQAPRAPNDRPRVRVRVRVRPKEAAMVRRWVPALVLGGVWWWAVLRLVLEPAHAGPVEGAVAAGGWGLSLLPVHVAETVRPMGIFDAGAGLLRRCAEGLREVGRAWQSLISGASIPGSSVPGSLSGPSSRGSGRPWRLPPRSGRAAGPSRGTGGRSWSVGRAWRATRAWRRRRSGGGSGRS